MRAQALAQQAGFLAAEARVHHLARNYAVALRCFLQTSAAAAFEYLEATLGSPNATAAETDSIWGRPCRVRCPSWWPRTALVPGQAGAGPLPGQALGRHLQPAGLARAPVQVPPCSFGAYEAACQVVTENVLASRS